jgi:hypothetical protein
MQGGGLSRCRGAGKYGKAGKNSGPTHCSVFKQILLFTSYEWAKNFPYFPYFPANARYVRRTVISLVLVAVLCRVSNRNPPLWAPLSRRAQ